MTSSDKTVYYKSNYTTNLCCFRYPTPSPTYFVLAYFTR